VNVNPTAVKYLLEHRTVADVDQIYRQATRLLLWQVRYFRPLEKEEHVVFVDPAEGKIFAYRHILDENAPGASLSPEEARVRAAEFLEQQGYHLEEFDLQDSRVEKRKARTDYTVVWQMRPGPSTSPLNVADVHFRLEVTVAGDEVVGLSRYFKLPEEWERQRNATTLVNVALIGALTLLVGGFGDSSASPWPGGLGLGGTCREPLPARVAGLPRPRATGVAPGRTHRTVVEFGRGRRVEQCGEPGDQPVSCLCIARHRYRAGCL
jgi:hypothetical protein